MDNSIHSGLLNDTYRLIQLARESALAQGKQAQVNKLSPVVDELKSLVNPPKETGKSLPANTSVAPAASGMMVQSDFQALLNASKSASPTQSISQGNNIAERNQIVRSMAASNMMDVDIARSLGMTREEVRMILSVGGK